MSEPLLVIDVNYLAHRAFHAFGDVAMVSPDGVGTGAIYGVLRDVVSLQHEFNTSRVVFAFDDGIGKRRSLYPEYKMSRSKRYISASPGERAARVDLQKQLRNLQENLLPMAGYRNIFYAAQYEADDIIARVCGYIPKNDEAVIISSDHDLWQCLRHNVWMWNPQTKKSYTAGMFEKQWGLSVLLWPLVKAYAGCSTDDIGGVRGVGEVTAARFLRGELPRHHKTYVALTTPDAKAVRDRNLPLVRLPFPGLLDYSVKKDEITRESWAAMALSLGMKSLINTVPPGVSRVNRGRKRAKG